MPWGFTGKFDDTGSVAGTPGRTTRPTEVPQLRFPAHRGRQGHLSRFNTNNRTVNGLPGGNGRGTCIGTNGDGPQSNQPAYGPSSGHSAIVNHLMAEARSIA